MEKRENGFTRENVLELGKLADEMKILENDANEDLPDNVIEFKAIVKSMADLYQRKNSDYGNSFEDSCNRFGPTAGIVRLYDKFNRICTLSDASNVQQVNDEAIEDTLLDLANYSIMLKMWMSKNKQQ